MGEASRMLKGEQDAERVLAENCPLQETKPSGPYLRTTLLPQGTQLGKESVSGIEWVKARGAVEHLGTASPALTYNKEVSCPKEKRL